MKKIISVELLQQLLDVIVTSTTNYSYQQISMMIQELQKLEDYKEEEEVKETLVEEGKEVE